MMQEAANLPSNLAGNLHPAPASVAVIVSVPVALSGTLVGALGKVVFSTAGIGEYHFDIISQRSHP
jgi:hypothetical protein